MLKSTPTPAWELQAWGAGPASEPVTLPFRQQRAEDQEAPAGTKNMQVTRAGGRATATTSYCPQNLLDRGLWVQAGMGGSWEEVDLCTHRPGPGSPGVSHSSGECFSWPPRPSQKPQSLLTRDPEEEQAGRTQKWRLRQTQMGPAVVTATGAEQASPRATEFKSLAAPHSVPPGPGAGSQR